MCISSFPKPMPINDGITVTARAIDGVRVMSYPCQGCGYIITGEPCEIDVVKGGATLAAASFCPLCKTRHTGRGERDDARH